MVENTNYKKRHMLIFGAAMLLNEPILISKLINLASSVNEDKINKREFENIEEYVYDKLKIITTNIPKRLAIILGAAKYLGDTAIINRINMYIEKTNTNKLELDDIEDCLCSQITHKINNKELLNRTMGNLN